MWTVSRIRFDALSEKTQLAFTRVCLRMLAYARLFGVIPGGIGPQSQLAIKLDLAPCAGFRRFQPLGLGWNLPVALPTHSH